MNKLMSFIHESGEEAWVSIDEIIGVEPFNMGDGSIVAWIVCKSREIVTGESVASVVERVNGISSGGELPDTDQIGVNRYELWIAEEVSEPRLFKISPQLSDLTDFTSKFFHAHIIDTKFSKISHKYSPLRGWNVQR